ncbi:MAG TPA: type II toxin-antitoxin system VapC family toxin [Actinomycetota bacterium]|nr:type II toxin-antitoxin system VapC family toxin [Actinomycetota bacterium]
MPEMPAIDVVSDANVALKWFHAEGEEEVPEARALVAAHQARTVALQVLDLTAYEVGNALLRGRAKATASEVATVLEALAEICPAVRPGADELRLAAELGARHDLTLYDAAYAAVAENRGATLATLDRALLKAGLGSRPSELVDELAQPDPQKRGKPR